MLMAETMEGSSGVSEGDGMEDGDNLEISLETLFQILNEEPAPSQSHSLPGIQKGFHQGTVDYDHSDPEREFQCPAGSAAIPEDFSKVSLPSWDSSNYIAATDYEVERGIGFLSEPVGTSNNLHGIYNPSPIDNGDGHLHVSEHADLENFCSNPTNYSAEWPSSSGQNSFFMDSVGGSFDTFMPYDFDQQQSQKSAGAGLDHTENAHFINDFYFDNQQEKDSKQIGVEGSLHAIMTETSDSNVELHNYPNTYVMPDSGVQEGNWYSSVLMCSPMNAGVMPAKADHAEVNPGDASNSCISLSRGSATDVDNALGQTFPSQHFRVFAPSREETVIPSMVEGEDQRLPYQKIRRSSEVKLASQKGSLDIFSQEASDPDMDASFLEVPSMKFNQCQDTSFKSDSSTDSSPIPSNRNTFVSSDIYGSAITRSKHLVPNMETIMPNRKGNSLLKDERKDQVLVPHYKQYDIPDCINAAAQKDSSKTTFIVDDDDDDVCILDDNEPVHSFPPPVHVKPHPLSGIQRSGPSDPYYNVLAGMRPKADDERLTFHIALQGLSQPKTEATPPDGVLSVPLLRHQRIALSWMVQKETSSLNCSGGILADDQGLGKTVSTIALILMERSSSSRSCYVSEEQNRYEALDVDDDDDDDEKGGDSEPKLMKKPCNDCPAVMDAPVKQENPVMAIKGRPAAGTLVVCPTSVLRQWAEELQNKVTSKANLSFLVYHGSNRTKDPNELAKYDVVLTTYAIVSMEVPKQLLLDKDDEDNAKPGASSVSMGHFSSKKRKKSPNSGLKNSKDNSLLESTARPLAKVGWFRVILDEAQSIKNHRTQVARACWGLRAKRRWCLSGTPIQNAVDDLYSYFRFLRYDPYAVYKSFCSTIKVPISRNPTNGYRKLQAVLKTIMLRRTKGTLIDGKPIITLPPKTVTLKKVDFSLEERTFYSALEAESQKQFKEYAAAGTVKQNYVNILLMLLRLRQACDHPLLVKGCDSNSTQRSSMEMAKKLPRGKLIYLLSCLEACLAICAICNDPPEDAVVTICGHVFCNQCISDHLTGDDNVCPSAQCKVQLTVASVFSRGTLKNSLADLPGSDCCGGDSSPDGPHKPKLHDDIMFSDSSKINAAIEILLSLPRSQYPSPNSNFGKSDNRPMESLKNGDNTVPERCSKDIDDRKHSEVENGSNAHVTEKAIVFSQWTRMLDLLEVPLKDSCIQYRRLDGTMSVAAREKAVKDFNTLPEVTVMIMSLKAASLGLNMVAACHVLLLDLWWNPTTEDQAIDRAHRIGQTRPVMVSRLTVKDTVEDRILALQGKKREMVASAFGEDESGSRQTRLTEEDLQYLFMA